MTTISTRVIDTTSGRPAVGVAVGLYARAETGWEEIGSGHTDRDGWARELSGGGVGPGVYALSFDTAGYQEQWTAFFDDVTVTFRVEPSDDELHLPLMLSPYGYSVYKGS